MFSIIQDNRVSQSVTEYYRVLYSECQGVLESVTECHRVSESVTECHRVSQSVAECYRVLQCVTECYRVLQSVTECYRVLQSITKTNLAHLLGPIFGLAGNDMLFLAI